jgi:integrase
LRCSNERSITNQAISALLYRRLGECLELRVRDIDGERRKIAVRGKNRKGSDTL